MGVDIHIVAVGSRSFVEQMALRYAPGHLVVVPHANILFCLGPLALGSHPSALSGTLGPPALGVTDLSGLIHSASHISETLSMEGSAQRGPVPSSY